MNITTDHPSSSYGIPVILDDDGEPIDYAPGVRAVRGRLGMTVAQLAEAVGKSRRTVEGWEGISDPHMPPSESLYVMAGLLRDAARRDG